MITCPQRFSNSSKANQSTLKDWKTRNGLQDFDRGFTAFSSKSAEIASSAKESKTKYVTLILKQSGAKLEPICSDLNTVFSVQSSNQVGGNHAKDLQVSAQLMTEGENLGP